MEYIIDQLKTIRQTLGMKQAELGDKVGLPQSHVSRIEKGTTNPRLSTITDMARAMDYELVLVPRTLVPSITSLLKEGGKQERKWQPDEETTLD